MDDKILGKLDFLHLEKDHELTTDAEDIFLDGRLSGFKIGEYPEILEGKT